MSHDLEMAERFWAAFNDRTVDWRQCHLIKTDADGKAKEHRAIRDDVGLMRQLGIVPGGS